MPEGHTIHRLARDLTRDLAGHRIRASSPQGRFDDGASLVDGKTLRATDAWGKHLFLQFPRTQIHIHLGLFGRFRRERHPAPEPRDTIRLRLVGSERTWDLSGPTICEVLTPGGRAAVLEKLGDDPLRDDADGAGFVSKVRKSRRSIGALLLDQKVIAGVGNVYRAELLFLAGLDPKREGRSIPEEALWRLWEDTREQLQRGVRLGRIVTMSGNGRTRGERLWVYKRSTCRRCSGRIRRATAANRTIWSCPSCQRG